MAGKSTTKAPAKAPAKSAEKAAAPAAPAAAEKLDNQPAAPSPNPAPTAVTPPASTEQPTSEAPGLDAGSSGQDAHHDTAPTAPDAAAATSSPAPAAPEAPVGGAAATGGTPSEQTGSEVQAATPPSGGTSADSVDDLDLDDGEVEGLWITAIPEQGFRRCGWRFTREGFGIALDALTVEQIEILENEPNLKVERGIFSGRVGERLE